MTVLKTEIIWSIAYTIIRISLFSVVQFCRRGDSVCRSRVIRYGKCIFELNLISWLLVFFLFQFGQKYSNFQNVWLLIHTKHFGCLGWIQKNNNSGTSWFQSCTIATTMLGALSVVDLHLLVPPTLFAPKTQCYCTMRSAKRENVFPVEQVVKNSNAPSLKKLSYVCS